MLCGVSNHFRSIEDVKVEAREVTISMLLPIVQQQWCLELSVKGVNFLLVNFTLLD